MGRKASGTSIEIQPGLYLKSHDGLLHCYFRIEGRAFRRSTRTDDIAEATERAKTWYRDAQLRASLGDSFEIVSFKRLVAAYEHHITGLSKAVSAASAPHAQCIDFLANGPGRSSSRRFMG